MKAKRIVCGFMVLVISTAISGCFNRIPNKYWQNPNLEDICLLTDVMVGEKGLEEWHENNVISRVSWHKLKLSDSHAKRYPALSEAFEEYNQQSLTDAKALMYELTPFAEEAEGDDFNPVYIGAEAKTYVQRADNHIVSLLEITEKYTGGIHPDYFIKGRNLDTVTGEKVKLSDVLTDTSELPAILEKKITEKYSGVTFFDLQDTFSKYKEEEFTWTIDYQGITFWFAPYEIAAYAVGTLSARLWFDEAPELFNEKYMYVPESYVMSIPVGYDIEFDLVAGDGKKDSVYTEKMLDQYGSYNMLSVVVNSQTCTDEINYAYDFDVYLAHIGDKNYIYSDSFSDNDYHMFLSWDINGDKPWIIEELYGTELDYEYVEEGFEDGTVYKKAFNNPDSFMLEKRFEILGTRGGTATFRVGEDGAPEMTDDAYTFNYGHDVTTKATLNAELLPDLEKTQLPVGTTLIPYQTDGESYVDLKTENGGIVRLSIDISHWPKLVDGMPEDECFENLLYAG